MGDRGPLAALTRRALLFDLGAAVAVVALGGCTAGGPDDPPSPSRSAAPSPGGASAGAPGSISGSPATGDGGLQWRRVIGGVSGAYVLVRGGEATVVDTGQAGTTSSIATALEELGLDWTDVSSVVLTHRHPDHVGSMEEVADAAAEAALYAGHADLEAMPKPREVTGVGTGDRVMGMQVIATPGHTPGHVSVFDPTAGVLVAGDAVNGTEDGGVAGPNPAFSDDMELAWESATTLAGLRPDVILFGHGPPATDDAAGQLETVVADHER